MTGCKWCQNLCSVMYLSHSFSMKNITGNFLMHLLLDLASQCGPGQQTQSGPARTGVLDQMPFSSLFQLQSFCDSIVRGLWGYFEHELSLPWHWLHYSFFSVPVASSAVTSLAPWFRLWNLNLHLENTYLSPLINCNLWLSIWPSTFSTHKFVFLHKTYNLHMLTSDWK